MTLIGTVDDSPFLVYLQVRPVSVSLVGITQLKSRSYHMLTYVSLKDDAFLTVSILRRLSAAILLL